MLTKIYYALIKLALIDTITYQYKNIPTLRICPSSGYSLRIALSSFNKGGGCNPKLCGSSDFGMSETYQTSKIKRNGYIYGQGKI